MRGEECWSVPATMLIAVYQYLVVEKIKQPGRQRRKHGVL